MNLGSVKLLELLLGLGANVNTKTDATQFTPLHTNVGRSNISNF